MTPHADLVARLRAIAARFDMTSTERYEQDAEVFYAATGYMAPGKDVPMAMLGGQNETERRSAHESWIAGRNRSQQQAIQEAADALAALPPPADPPHDCEAWRLEGLGCARCNKADPPAIVALGERLRTQDNQMTAHPIFVVEHRNDARRPWEFVTACLTDEGARAYMNANGHNLRKFSRIFVHSGYRNDQWIGLRNHLMALPAAPPVTDTPQGWTPEYIASARARAYPPQIQVGDVIEFAHGDDPPMFQRLLDLAAVEDWNGKLRNRVRGIYRRIYPKPAAPPQEDTPR